MKRQTAIDYLLDQLPNKHALRYQLNQKGIIKKAKEMEQEQIMKTWYDCKYITIIDKTPMDAEEYYNETYGK